MEDAARAALTDRNGHPFAQPDPFTRSGVVDGVSAPVSYTHLDVYKRQAMVFKDGAVCFENREEAFQ